MQKVADEAQFLALLRLVGKAAPDATVTIFARPHPGAGITPDDETVSVIPTASLAAVARALACADLFILVGGCFMESPRQAAACSILMLLARACRTPVIAIGVTAFPYRRLWARWIYSRVFNATTEITVREAAAQQALTELPLRTRVTRLADPRYVLTPGTDDDSDDLLEELGLSLRQPLVGVTLRYMHYGMPDWVKASHGYSPDAVEWANDALACALDALAAEAQLVVLPMHASHDEDLAAAQAIRARMRTPHSLCSSLPRLRTPQLMALVNRCDLVLASRLAAGMISVSTATPVFGIAYEKRLLELMSGLGLGAYVMPWLAADSSHLEAIARRAWIERRQIRQAMLDSGRMLVESAWANAEIIARQLAQG
ncbi:MAG: polysaccharide pyruvyl transferase family protein [Gammaproteobacteria bacterium]